MTVDTPALRSPRRSRRRATLERLAPEDAARAALLRYVSADAPGITRHGRGSRVWYVAPDGSRISDRRDIQRIRQLAIPPAWTDVWICANPNGHLQATGRDARGRKQYRYHARWREVRDAEKYSRLLVFGEALTRIRARVASDLARTGFPREKVLAMIVRLLETTFVRVGNASYAKSNGSFGLTTLQNRHVRLARSGLRLRFRGKSGIQHDVLVTDKKLARLVRRCRELPGQDLFQYVDDDGAVQPVTSTDVNDYLKDASGSDFTAKDYRTWAGTLLAIRYAAEHLEPSDAPPPKSFSVELVKEVAHALGNTPAVCRKCYIHPAVFTALGDTDGLRLFGGVSGRSSTQEEQAQWEDALTRLLRHGANG